VPSRLVGEPRIERVEVYAFTVPTDGVEADGTLEWSATTLVLVRARASGLDGLGFSYTAAAAAPLIEHLLAPEVVDGNALSVPALWGAMIRAVRNVGRPGLCSTAIAAVDTALWDLKARLLGLPLVDLFGRCRDRVSVYGSGGFTSYDDRRLAGQLGGWVERGISSVKIKIGRDRSADLRRVRVAREAIGEAAELFVDANGAYDRKQALAMAEEMQDARVSWFEEPVTSDDLDGLRLLRDRAPPVMDITAGEYGYEIGCFRRMLEAGAVDVLQADVTRCAGYTELLRVAALCGAHRVALSAHTAPSLHAHVCCALPECRHVELFHDHVRLEGMLFDGALDARDGALVPSRERAGNGLALKPDAAQFQVYGFPLGEAA
jgi:L-alanine-DL-glutamate epimerase-like enolase superfamily enzyme